MATALVDRSVKLAAADGTTCRCVVNHDRTAVLSFEPGSGRIVLSHADLADVRDLIADVLADAPSVDPDSPPPAGARVP